MNTVTKLNKPMDGFLFAQMIHAGTAYLRMHAQTINNLNVFPIPDGDTGDNMLLTMLGGADAVGEGCENLAEASQLTANGMLLSARGNSGVILSQFFYGIAEGFRNLIEADTISICKALQCGVQHAYHAVMEPTEGTILTVVHHATEYVCSQVFRSPEEMLDGFIDEAKRTLDRTPEMLSVLKKAGVVDSGGAGLVCIAEGVRKMLTGELEAGMTSGQTAKSQEIDVNLFTENSILEYGYCTELLLRLQRCKTDPDTFDVKEITDYLQTIGDSVAAFKTGSIIKLHVHTMTPGKVFDFCQQYGEFLKVKVDNMSLQHNNAAPDGIRIHVTPPAERKRYGVAAVASGDGIKQLFLDRGADEIVDGGQSMNPSTEDFLLAFEKVNADTILVFPNNSNIILTARQAADMYSDSDVHVIESRTIGDGYAALSMLDTDSADTDQIIQDLQDAMNGVVTAEISRCVRDADMNGTRVHCGDYIGFVGKDIIAADICREIAVDKTIDALNPAEYDVCILIGGIDSEKEEMQRIESYIHKQYPYCEVYPIDGMQDIYSYILILE